MEKNILSEKHEMIRVNQHTICNMQDEIVAEHPLKVYYNSNYVFSLSCSPAHIEELVVGALFHRSFISSASEIQTFTLSEDGHNAYVVCIAPISTTDTAPTKDNVQLTATLVYDLMAQNLSASELFQNTGGVHCVSLFLTNVPLISMEDLARHNAVDKVIGYALLHGLPLAASTLIVSGRLSADMLEKAVKAQIPIVLSKSAPTSLAVSLAQRHHMTLVGFIRGTRMNLYTNPQRIDYTN